VCDTSVFCFAIKLEKFDIPAVAPIFSPNFETILNFAFVVLFKAVQSFVQYGQVVYNTLTDAILNVQNETFINFENVQRGGILIGIISVTKDASNSYESVVECNMSRGIDFKPFKLVINSEGLPEIDSVTIQVNDNDFERINDKEPF